MSDMAYRSLVYAHLLLFVLWLGGDVGVFVLGQHFRRRTAYSLEQRLALLKLLVAVDMGPRSAWALMVPLSLSVATAGGWVSLPFWLVGLAWVAGLAWLALVWDAHLHDMTPRAARDRRIEAWVKYAIAAFYLWLGATSLLTGAPIAVPWLAWKALLFGLIFIAAILIDVAFKPVGPQLGRLIAEGSSDATELPLRRTMDRTRIFVLIVYALLFVIAWLGVVKPG
ncbi:hypothetical protein ACLB0R_04430 [Sphingomonas sp. GlSt437]|uniref:hypothetical protein n=1 Tax=Sphingomonas sp. GlSt437 TaxID=3389970 RepID=UPI003A845800